MTTKMRTAARVKHEFDFIFYMSMLAVLTGLVALVFSLIDLRSIRAQENSRSAYINADICALVQRLPVPPRSPRLLQELQCPTASVPVKPLIPTPSPTKG